jgi:hypothetical protein
VPNGHSLCTKCGGVGTVDVTRFLRLPNLAVDQEEIPILTTTLRCSVCNGTGWEDLTPYDPLSDL